MNFKQSFFLALKSLRTSKMRSFLTMLGIIIGIAAVIILVSIVNGFKADMVNQFEEMGTNQISVTIIPRGSNRKIEVEDMYQYAQENPDTIAYISPTVSISGVSVKFGTETAESTSVTGIGEDYVEIKGYDVTQGRFLQYMDIERRQKNCVVGSYIAQEYFGGNAIGQPFKINGNQFTIVGVIDEQADSTEGSADDMVLIPYTLGRSLSRMGTVNSYTVAVTDSNMIDSVVEDIKNFLYKTLANENAYRVIAIAQILDVLDDLTGQLTMILVGIAGISLLVGGIGIMNIMLVSVTERTREIGIRKSIGAKRWDIMSQFVVEAATTSAVGGVIGIILGIAVSILVCNLMGIPPAISPLSVIVAFSVSAGIGILFGYMPANKAAKLNPIEALRYD